MNKLNVTTTSHHTPYIYTDNKPAADRFFLFCFGVFLLGSTLIISCKYTTASTSLQFTRKLKKQFTKITAIMLQRELHGSPHCVVHTRTHTKHYVAWQCTYLSDHQPGSLVFNLFVVQSSVQSISYYPTITTVFSLFPYYNQTIKPLCPTMNSLFSL